MAVERKLTLQHEQAALQQDAGWFVRLLGQRGNDAGRVAVLAETAVGTRGQIELCTG